MITAKEHEQDHQVQDRKEGVRLLVLWVCWLVLAVFLCVVGVVVW